LRAHAIGRDRLREVLERDELPWDGPPPDGPSVVLLARPEADEFAKTSAGELLLKYWRLLFHARVRSAVAAAIDATPLPRAAVQMRVEALGRPAFNEARFVLYRERYLAASAEDVEAYAEFAALYLELSSFAPEALPWFFAAIEDPAAALALIGRDVDPEAVLRNTRPTGATDPHPGLVAADAGAGAGGTGKPKRRIRRDAAHREKLLKAADDADAVGNDVRAAIWRMRVYRASFAPGGARDGMSAVYADALRDLDQLTARLKAALDLDDSEARQWRAWLVELLEHAAGGWWNADGRLLYDVQKVCVYHEREIYSVNVVEYLLDFARRPLRRPQPGQRRVLALKSLRSALRRTGRSRLSAHGRAELQRLLGAAVHRVEGTLRDFLRPTITSALDEGGLNPAGATEAVARAKLTEELLDEITENGYLRFPAVRDAVSRNQMKLDDLGTPPSPAAPKGRTGDQLLRVDRKLEENLDFVYRRAEIYLRGFHRLSSAFFATHIGRIVTRGLILPLGGAFLILEALDHTVGLLIHKLFTDKQAVVVAVGQSAGHALAPTTAGPPHAHEAIFNQWWALITLGLLLFGVINAPPFRRAVAKGFKRFFRALGVVFIDAPRWVATRPPVVAFFKSQFVRLLGRYVFKPLAVAALAYLFVPDALSRKTQMLTLACVFVAVNLLLNSRAGRAIEQAIWHAFRTTFARVTWEIFAALARRIVRAFQSVLEAIDRVLYAVDELLRFRAGQKRSTVAYKAVLGVFWFYVAYVTRFAINLLVEPQVNPIKHFPVVTVSHKMLFPAIFPLKSLLQTLGFGEAESISYATGIIWCIPGIFGFLAWEFKENWKLYRANRSVTLKPVRVGSHGETVATFLRPGFHSGTVPKVFHRLRKAQLRSAAPLPPTHKHLRAAHHVEEALVAFFDREFLALLNRHPLFASSPVTLGHIHLASTLIRVELNAGEGASPLVIGFEQRAGWILAGVEHAGWAAELSAERSRQLGAALIGLYKLAGADMVREQVESQLPAGTRFDLRRNDLVVWPDGDFAVEIAYDLAGDGPALTARGGDAAAPPLAWEQVLFRKVDLRRDTWNLLWDRAAGDADVRLPQVRVLPAREAAPPETTGVGPAAELLAARE
jgi:hypothetical protein